MSGFWVPFALDSTVVIDTIGYFLALGFRGSAHCLAAVTHDEADNAIQCRSLSKTELYSDADDQ